MSYSPIRSDIYLLEFEEPTPKTPLWRPYSMTEDGVAEWQTLCVVDARGVDLVGWAAEVSDRAHS